MSRIKSKSILDRELAELYKKEVRIQQAINSTTVPATRLSLQRELEEIREEKAIHQELLVAYNTNQRSVKDEDTGGRYPLAVPEELRHILPVIHRTSTQYGAEFWRLNQFITRIEEACQIRGGQNGFNFNAYVYHRMNGQGGLFLYDPRPTEGPQLYRFLELFGSLGFYIVWSWQRINFERSLPLTLFDIMDDTSMSIEFTKLVDLIYFGALIDHGTKTTVRVAVKDRERQKRDIYCWFQRRKPEGGGSRDYPYPINNKELDRLKQLTAPDPNDVAYIATEFIEEENKRTFLANKRLVMKWCAQAININTAASQYQIPIFHKSDALPAEEKQAMLQDFNRVSREQRDSLLPPSNIIIDPEPEEKKARTFHFRNNLGHIEYVPTDPEEYVVKVEPHSPDPELDEIHMSAGGDGRPRQRRRYDPGPGPGPGPSPSPNQMYTKDVTIEFDVNVKQLYEEAIEELRRKNLSHSEIENRLLLEWSIMSQVFFAELVSILANERRILRSQSIPGKIVMNRMREEKCGLMRYFARNQNI